MRKIRINLSNRIYFTLASLILVLILILGVHAYGTSDPPVFGHSAGELEGVAIPSGAIMAFNLVSCPSGWSEYVAARGKTVVGINSAEGEFDTLEETGGEKTHTLTVAEMPSHTHQVIGGGASDDAQRFETADGGLTSTPSTEPAGGNQPHNNLQPYVTLLYCIKN